jgi:hypothetical protein
MTGRTAWLGPAARIGCHGPVTRRIMPRMVEYGNGVGQATGVAGGSGGGGGSMDAGAAVGQFFDNAVHTISTMPPTQLALLVIVIVIGLVIFKRAF